MQRGEHRSGWQWFFIGLAAIGFGILLFTSRAVIGDTWDVLKDVDVRLLFLLPLMQLTSYLFIAGYYKKTLSIFDHEISYARAYGTVVSVYFIEQVLPSGGVSGMSYLAYALRTVASVGLTTMVQLSRYLLSYAAYILVIAVALVFLSFDDPINTRAIGIGVALAAGLVISGFIIKYLVEAQRHIDSFVKGLSRFVNTIAKKVFRREKLLKAEAIKKNLTDFHNGVERLLKKRTQVLKPFMYMALSTTTQLGIIYVSFLAIGETVNPGVIFIAFAVANIVGVISVIPGDVGVHEAAMVFVLSASGVDTPVALSATLLYRVFNKLIMLTIGFIVYTQFLKPAKNDG